MAERRSLGDAIISPEKLAFIQGGTAPEKAPRILETPPASDISLPSEPKASERKPKAPKRPTRETRPPEPTEVLNQMLVPVTNRFQHRTAQALRKAHLERKLNNMKPDTQQEIVEIAVQAWLEEHGYLD